MTHAVEQAWNAGIVVVVAGGNDGTDRLSLANPAMDPRVIAVGASDAQGTLDTADDTVPYFSARGNLIRHVDFVAPGAHVASLAVPGSVIAEDNPKAVVGSAVPARQRHQPGRRGHRRRRRPPAAALPDPDP